MTILGSGTCVPSLKRSSCSVLIETGDAKILVDVGPGTIRRILEAGMLISQVTHVLISHLHLDHVGELASFLFSSKCPSPRKERITIVAAQGLIKFFKRLNATFGPWVELGGELLKIIELPYKGSAYYDFGDFVLQSLPMVHIAHSIGFRVTSPEGYSVVYSGDTDYCENLVKLSQGAELLICECSLPDSLKVKGHLCPSLAGKIAAEAGVKQLVLTHFYPQCDNVDIKNQCRTTFQGPMVLAQDLMTISLPIEPLIAKQ